MLSAYDRRLARRAGTLAGLAALITFLVVATTDQGAPFPERAGMVAALAPLAGSLGALAALRLADGRGELRALAAIGVDPVRAARGAALGGVAVGALGPALAVTGLLDLRALFPQPLSARVWVTDGAGLRELTQGLYLAPSGALELIEATASPASAPPVPLFFTVTALALAALAGPGWITAPRSLRGRIAVGLLALLGAIVAFQGVAAGRLPPAALLAAPCVLLIDGAVARYRARGIDG